MASIKKLLISIIFVIVLFIVIYKQLNNIRLQERVRTTRFSGLAEDQATLKSCLKTPPTVSLSTVNNPITIFADETYTLNAANSADYNNQSQLSYYWQIVSNPDNIREGMTSPVSAGYNFTIPANTYKNSENAKMALVVKSNVKPYLTNSIIRNLNIIVNPIPVLVLNPSSNFSAEANNNIQITNSSYVEYPLNTSSNFVTFSATATPSSGVISQPTVATQLNNNGIIFSPYRYVPNTTNTVDVNVNVKNATYPTKEVSKSITMSLTLNLIQKFNGSLSYSIPNYRDMWPYWDKSRDSNFGITANITEKNGALSNIIPRVSDLSYLWKAMRNGNLIIGTIFNNDKSASVTTGISWPTVNNSYEFICDISYGLFSIPITLRTPPIKYIETILIGSSSSSYIDYNVYTSINNQGQPFIQYTEYIDPITRKTVGVRFNTNFEFGQMVYLPSGGIWKTMKITNFSGASFSYSESSTFKRYIISKTNILEITKNLNNPNTLQFRYFESSIGSIYSPTFYIYSSDGFLDIPPINCVVSDQWGECSVLTPSCTGGTQRKTILQYPNATGTPCPPESELTRRCNVDINLCSSGEI